MEGIDETIWESFHAYPRIDIFGQCIHSLFPLMIPARKFHGDGGNDNYGDCKENHYLWSPPCSPSLPHPYFCCRIFREVIENDDKYGGPVFILLRELCSCEAYDWSWRGYNVRRSSPPIVKGCELGSTMNKTCFNTPPICFTPPPPLPPHQYLWGSNIFETIGTISKILWSWHQHMHFLITTHRLRPCPCLHTNKPQLLRPILAIWSTKVCRMASYAISWYWLMNKLTKSILVVSPQNMARYKEFSRAW